MSILYLQTSPAPPIEGTDAVFQEIKALCAAFDGSTLNMYPGALPGRYLPAQLLGFHKLAEMRRRETQCRLNHLYFSVPYYFPVLRFLRKPIVYSVVASLTGRAKPRNLRQLGALHKIIVASDRDAEILDSWGLRNYAVVRPGVATGRLAPSELPLGDELVLLMASAPWVEEQFDLKGIDVLLDAVVAAPNLKLILLWRGLLLEELRERVARRDIADRVEIVTEHVSIGDFLARAHAGVLLAKRGDIVKSYPHSLIESLMAGKPVILTEAISMAEERYTRGTSGLSYLSDRAICGLCRLAAPRRRPLVRDEHVAWPQGSRGQRDRGFELPSHAKPIGNFQGARRQGAGARK